MMRWRSAIEVSRFVSSRAGPLFYLAPNGFFFCSFTSFLPGFSFSPLFFSLPDRNGSVYDGAAGRWRRSTAAIAPPSSSPVSSWILLGFQPSFTRYSHECAPWPPRRCAAYLMMRRPARFAFDGVSFLFLFFLNRFHAIRTEFFFFFLPSFSRRRGSIDRHGAFPIDLSVTPCVPSILASGIYDAIHWSARRRITVPRGNSSIAPDLSPLFYWISLRRVV